MTEIKIVRKGLPPPNIFNLRYILTKNLIILTDVPRKKYLIFAAAGIINHMDKVTNISVNNLAINIPVNKWNITYNM